MVQFFYDEAFHDRKITEKAVDAKDFCPWFFAGIVGIEDSQFSSFEKAYSVFEEKHRPFYAVTELKSQLIGKKKYLSGLASFKDEDLSLVGDLLCLVSNAGLFLYFGVISKIEFLVNQIFRDYQNNPAFDADNFRYSISKVIDLYRPGKVLHAIYAEDQDFVHELRLFLQQKIKENVAPLKSIENVALQEALLILQKSEKVVSLNWDYQISFLGFNKYLAEEGIGTYSLVIDREGTGHTLESAQAEGIEKCGEMDSRASCGIRCADMLVGLLGRFVDSISRNLDYSDGETQKKRLLPETWFDLDEARFDLYRQLDQVFYDQRNAWYKYFATNYSDSLVYFLSLLAYFSHFKNYADFQAIPRHLHAEYVNGVAAQALQSRFEQMQNKLGIDIVNSALESDFIVNQKGAKCFRDWHKQPSLPLTVLSQPSEVGDVYRVLSVGFLGEMKCPCVTIEEKGQAICYALPQEYTDWACQMVDYAQRYRSFFPRDVEFRNFDGHYDAKIL